MTTKKPPKAPGRPRDVARKPGDVPVEGVTSFTTTAPTRPFTDILDPSHTFDTITDELIYWARTQVVAKIVGPWLDVLRDRVALGDPPDQILNVVGTGAPVSIPHKLVDGMGKAVAPRAYRLLGWSGADTFLVSSMDANQITVTVTNTGTVQLGLYI